MKGPSLGAPRTLPRLGDPVHPCQPLLELSAFRVSGHRYSAKHQAFGLKKPRPSWLRKLLLLRDHVILELLKEKIVRCNIGVEELRKFYNPNELKILFITERKSLSGAMKRARKIHGILWIYGSIENPWDSVVSIALELVIELRDTKQFTQSADNMHL
ncbi:hypothetical protein EK904_004686 [Melospiza melodia maxima]|nr:hypothetical protein EK904_004686 [Melospiza melodia maxima]